MIENTPIETFQIGGTYTQHVTLHEHGGVPYRVYFEVCGDGVCRVINVSAKHSKTGEWGVMYAPRLEDELTKWLTNYVGFITL